jgi:glycosyltransferase involved in cell wall biosynthesis
MSTATTSRVSSGASAAQIGSIDLVVATVGDAPGLECFLQSVAAQSYRDVRAIVVDQNDDDRLGPLLAKAGETLPIVHVRSAPGLSRARNAGLAHVSGDLVAFPDDDCWYPDGLLEGVVAALTRHPEWAGLSVCVRDSRGELSSMLWDRSAGPIGRYSIWRRAISIGLFLRPAATAAAAGFREDLGQGSGTRWGSGEESDYVLRVLERGLRLQYEPSLHVHHESPAPAFSRAESRKAHAYGMGHGRVLRLHHYPAWFVAFRVAQLSFGSLVFLLTGRLAKARYYFAMARGRAQGWLQA